MKSEIRMPKSERNPNSEPRNPKTGVAARMLWNSSFVILSSFVIRHLAFHHPLTRFPSSADYASPARECSPEVDNRPGIQSRKARGLKLHLLDVHDEIARSEVHVIGQSHFHGNGREVGHDRAAIGVHEVKPQIVFAFLAAEESHAQGDGALGMDAGALD